MRTQQCQNKRCLLLHVSSFFLDTYLIPVCLCHFLILLLFLQIHSTQDSEIFIIVRSIKWNIYLIHFDYRQEDKTCKTKTSTSIISISFSSFLSFLLSYWNLSCRERRHLYIYIILMYVKIRVTDTRIKVLFFGFRFEVCRLIRWLWPWKLGKVMFT